MSEPTGSSGIPSVSTASSGIQHQTSFEEAFELTGHGIFNYLALFTNGFLLLYVVTECLGIGYVLNKANCDLKVDTKERGTLSAATLIGVVTPSIMWGYLADSYGRKRVMLPCTVSAVLCSVMSSLSVNFASMFLLRMLTGMMVSASCATVFVYLGELTSPSERTAFIAWGSIFIGFSYFTMPGLAWILLPLNFSIPITDQLTIVSWRILICGNTIWGTLACVGMLFLPESPAFLHATKGSRATVEVLANIYARNKKGTAQEYPVKELTAHPTGPLTFVQHFGRMKYLIKPPLLKCVLISHACNFMVYMQSNTVYVWMPHIIDELLKATPSNPDRSLCDTLTAVHGHEFKEPLFDDCAISVHPLVYPITLFLFVPGSLVFVGLRYFINKLGYTKMYSVILSSCSIFALLAAFVPSTIAAIVLYIPGACGNAANTVMAAAVVESFPVDLRALAMCTLYMMGRLGSAVGMYVLAWGLAYNCAVAVCGINLLAIASGALLLLWPDPEKTRRSMEAHDFSY